MVIHAQGRSQPKSMVEGVVQHMAHTLGSVLGQRMVHIEQEDIEWEELWNPHTCKIGCALPLAHELGRGHCEEQGMGVRLELELELRRGSEREHLDIELARLDMGVGQAQDEALALASQREPEHDESLRLELREARTSHTAPARPHERAEESARRGGSPLHMEPVGRLELVLGPAQGEAPAPHDAESPQLEHGVPLERERGQGLVEELAQVVPR